MTLPYPVQPAPQPGGWIGEIGYTPTHVFLPTGTFPIRGSSWSVNNMTHAAEKMSTLGIILAVVLFPFLCVFSLFFLLMKETEYVGTVQVTVTGPGYQYTTSIPSLAPNAAYAVAQQVNYAQSLAG